MIKQANALTVEINFGEDGLTESRVLLQNVIANSPPLISACSESGNMVNDSSESEASKLYPHSQNTPTHGCGAPSRCWTLHDFPYYHGSHWLPVFQRNENDVNCIYLGATKGGVEYLNAKLISRMGQVLEWNYCGWFQECRAFAGWLHLHHQIRKQGTVLKSPVELMNQKWINPREAEKKNGQQQTATSKWQQGATLASAESRGLSLNK